MKRIFVCMIVCLVFTKSILAQSTRYIIRFKDKGSNPYSISDPIIYLSQKAIDRRIRYSIPVDSTDLPVTPRYMDSIRNAGAVTILNSSKWLNSITIRTTDSAALVKIRSFSFVQSSDSIAARKAVSLITDKYFINQQTGSGLKITGDASYYNYGQSFQQIHIHNGEFLHDIGLRGQSMIIGMLDAGYQNYTSLHAFDSVNANGQVLDVYDFVTHDNSVVEDNSHGMECFSTIAANIPGQFVGTAPKANFFLYRTEDAFSEYPVEEHNWVCGAERIDSAGGDVISSSLGYTTFDNPAFNHTYADLNGNTTIAAIGADLAAKKGLMVIVAAGNEGNASWHYISTPADADSAMAVGAVNALGSVAAFSGFGPSSDGRIKPDVASVGQGTVIETPGNAIGMGNGTSFACPNLAGLATCLWQGFPEFNNMKIIHALQLAGNIASAPDNRIGYGIPDVKKALLNLLKDFSASSAGISNCSTTINWKSKDLGSMKYSIERQLPGQTAFTKIKELSGTGNVFGTNNYQYTDTLNNANAGTITYRINQVIDTASASITSGYISTISLTLNSSCITTGIDPVTISGNDVQIMPNPAHNSFDLKITTSLPVHNLQVRITNTGGQFLSIINSTKQAGTVHIPVSISNLPKGRYLVSIYADGRLLNTKDLIRL